MTEQKSPIATRLDFAKIAGLEAYAGLYALVIDDAFTQAELAELLKSATDHAKWDIAQVNVGNNLQITDTSYRNSKRILYDSVPLAKVLFDRVKPYIDDIALLDPKTDVGKFIMGRRGKSGKKWEVVGLNERLRFLKYEKGEFFQPHCDGAYTRPDNSESSFLTFQLYIDSKNLEGGATRFFDYHAFQLPTNETPHFDVEAKPGRVLIFQHSRLEHSGEAVISGTKIALRTDFMFKPVEDAPFDPGNRKDVNVYYD